MTAINIGPEPVKLENAAGLTDAVLQANSGAGETVLMAVDIQNRGPDNVTCARAATAPDPETVLGNLLARGQCRRFYFYQNALTGPWWAWTTTGEATLWLERVPLDAPVT